MECSSGACRTTCEIVIIVICGPERPKIKWKNAEGPTDVYNADAG